MGQNIPNPLHFAEIGAGGALKDIVINYAVTYSEGSPWQQHFLHVANGHIRDLGYVEIEPEGTRHVFHSKLSAAYEQGDLFRRYGRAARITDGGDVWEAIRILMGNEVNVG